MVKRMRSLTTPKASQRGVEIEMESKVIVEDINNTNRDGKINTIRQTTLSLIWSTAMSCSDYHTLRDVHLSQAVEGEALASSGTNY